MGKTTVAVSLAHAQLAEFGGAVHFVDLGSLDDPSLVPTALASTLGRNHHYDSGGYSRCDNVVTPTKRHHDQGADTEQGGHAQGLN
jgi:predicted ATPase